MLDLNKKFYTELINLDLEIKKQKLKNGYCKITENEYTEDELNEFMSIIRNSFKNYSFKIKSYPLDNGVETNNKLVIFYEWENF